MKNVFAGSWGVFSALMLVAPATIASATTITLQQGINSYAGAEYATIQGSAVNGGNSLSNIHDWRLYAFGLADSSRQQAGLLKFSNITGNGTTQVPTGATVTSATLKLYVAGFWGTGSPSTAAVNLYTMNTSWSASTVTDTYRSYESGTPTAYWGNDSLAHNGPVSGVDFDIASHVTQSVVSTQVNSWITLDVTAIVQSWVNDATSNNGLVMFGSGTSYGMYFRSPSQNALGPILTIDYTTVPEPASLALLMIGGLLLVNRPSRAKPDERM